MGDRHGHAAAPVTWTTSRAASSVTPFGRRLTSRERTAATMPDGVPSLVDTASISSVDRDGELARGVGHPVGVQHERVAVNELDHRVVGDRRDESEQRAGPPDPGGPPICAP